MVRKHIDLVAACAVALGALISVIGGLDSVVMRTLVGLPLALLVPGYALTALMPHRSLGLTERLLFSSGLSFGVMIISGLLLHVSLWGLRAVPWAVLLSTITCIASALAVLRQRKRSGDLPTVRYLPLVRELAMFGLALVIVIGALGVTRAAAEQETGPGFTQVWLLPDTQGESNRIHIGMTNMEATTMTYVLRLTADGTVLYTWPAITLAPDERWESTALLDQSTAGYREIRGEVYRQDAPDVLYRHVSLQRGGAD